MSSSKVHYFPTNFNFSFLHASTIIRWLGARIWPMCSNASSTYQSILSMKRLWQGLIQAAPSSWRRKASEEASSFCNFVFLFRALLILAILSYECKCRTGCLIQFGSKAHACIHSLESETICLENSKHDAERQIPFIIALISSVSMLRRCRNIYKTQGYSILISQPFNLMPS